MEAAAAVGLLVLRLLGVFRSLEQSCWGRSSLIGVLMVVRDAPTEVHLVLVAVAQELLARLSPPKAIASKADLAATGTSTLSLGLIMVAVAVAVMETLLSGAVQMTWHQAGWVVAVLALNGFMVLPTTGQTAYRIQAGVAAVRGLLAAQ